MATHAENKLADKHFNEEEKRQKRRDEIIGELRRILRDSKADKNTLYDRLVVVTTHTDLKLEEGFREKTAEEMREAISEVIGVLEEDSKGVIRVSGKINSDEDSDKAIEDKKFRELSPEQKSKLFATLEARFKSKPEHYKRIEGVDFADVKKALEANPEALYSLYKMEETGGEPDVLSVDINDYIFADFSKESPIGRRNCVYDKEAEKDADGFNGNAVDMAKEFDIDLMSEGAYRAMQKKGAFDIESRSWLATPVDTRESGDALRGDRYGGAVGVRRNNAYRCDDSRGWRGVLRVRKV